MNRRVIWLGLAAWMLLATSTAEAQLRSRDFRLSLDTDILSMAAVKIEPEGGAEYDTMVYGIGPNQLGGSQASPFFFVPATPLGLGLGFVITPRFMFGIRTGFGLDVVTQDDTDDERKILAVSLMPGFTFVPIGQRAKLFLSASPIFQVNRDKTDAATRRVMMGGFSLGIGVFIFAGSSVSVDLGFHFEGRFGGFEGPGPRDEADLRDLRGVVRLGISLWK